MGSNVGLRRLMWLAGCAVALAGAPQGAALAQTVTATAKAADVTALNALEQKRLAAMKARDGAAVRALLSDDYVHVHSTGRLDTADGFSKGIVARPRVSERGPLTLRVYGDVAVINGEQTNQTVAADGSLGPVAKLLVTQVAHREGGGWKFVSMHTTPTTTLPGNAPADLTYPASTPQPTKVQEEVVALEMRRAKAIADRDFKALADCLADDYLHVYGGGTSGGKDQYIEQVTKGPRVPTRGPLKVRVYGDVAVITGDLLNRIQYPDQPPRVLDTYVTQVARKVDGQWKFVSFQITPKQAE